MTCLYVLHKIINICSKCMALSSLVLFPRFCYFPSIMLNLPADLLWKQWLSYVQLFRSFCCSEQGNIHSLVFSFRFLLININIYIYYRSIPSRKGVYRGREEGKRVGDHAVVSSPCLLWLSQQCLEKFGKRWASYFPPPCFCTSVCVKQCPALPIWPFVARWRW